MLNKQQQLPHLEAFCKDMFEKHEIRFQPHNPPVDLILDKLMGEMKDVYTTLNNLIHLVNGLCAAQTIDATKEEAPIASDKKQAKKKAVKNVE